MVGIKKGGKSVQAGKNKKMNITTPPDSPNAHDAVLREVSSWKGVTVHTHRFGGVEFRLGRRELGHLHARFADLPFPRRVRDDLVAAGRARPHHILPESGWVTVPMQAPSDIDTVIDLFRLNYDRTAP
jgi:Luciferase